MGPIWTRTASENHPLIGSGSKGGFRDPGFYGSPSRNDPPGLRINDDLGLGRTLPPPSFDAQPGVASLNLVIPSSDRSPPSPHTSRQIDYYPQKGNNADPGAQPKSFGSIGKRYGLPRLATGDHR